jgi:pimeloyl-ACP methyl ester carboxylesterase
MSSHQALGSVGAGYINVRGAGTQEPALVFVHGFACALEDWDAQMTALAPRFRCLSLDLPGHGGSDKPATVSVEAMGEAVNRVREEAGAGRTVLIGHSMGCRVITEAFQQSPSTVAGLIFVDGSILGGDPETAIKRAKDAIDRVGMDAFTQQIFKDMFLEDSDPKLREWLVTRAQRIDARFREELFLDSIRWDLNKARDALKRVTISALVLQSTYINADLKRVPLQPGMTTPWMDAVASLVPMSKARIIPEIGHFAMIEAAAAVNDEVQKFAARIAL